VLLQDDRFDATESVTVCPFTTTDVAAPLLRVPVPIDDVSGLDAASWVMIDKITTVRRAHVKQRIGRLSTAQLGQVERLLMAFLGLAD